MLTRNKCKRKIIAVVMTVAVAVLALADAFQIQSPWRSRPQHLQTQKLCRTTPAQTRSAPTALNAFEIIVLPNDDDDDGEENNEEEEEEDEEPETEDPYTKIAKSEFQDGDTIDKSSALSYNKSEGQQPTTSLDWGGALGTLRERMDDAQSGQAQPLFRLLSKETPNQLIGNFVQSANPQVVQAMSGAISSLLGGLSTPAGGIETIVKASGDKVGSLCFQLQMTGYMFRNAEYVVALRDMMELDGSATLKDYKAAFRRIDTDDSGYIDRSEVQTLLDDVYQPDGTPTFEVDTFLQFFDQNKDGKISWEEFERGLGTAVEAANSKTKPSDRYLLDASDDEEDEDDDYDDDDDDLELNAEVSGTIEVELAGGKIVKVDAKQYIQSLKEEAQALKDALRRGGGESLKGDGIEGISGDRSNPMAAMGGGGLDDDDALSIIGYIASRQGNVKALTEGIRPEIVDTMKKLVDFVLEGGGVANTKGMNKSEMVMEIPGSALQQLALWQLVLGYRLREAEAKGDYRKLLDQ